MPNGPPRLPERIAKSSVPAPVPSVPPSASYDKTAELYYVPLTSVAGDPELIHRSAARAAAFLAEAIPDDRQFIAFADTNHGVPDHYEFIADKSIIAMLAAKEVKTIGVEIPEIMQKDIDDFYEGKIIRLEFLQALANKTSYASGSEESKARIDAALADLIENSRGYGIEIAAVDPGMIRQVHEDSPYGRAVLAHGIALLNRNPALAQWMRALYEKENTRLAEGKKLTWTQYLMAYSSERFDMDAFPVGTQVCLLQSFTQERTNDALLAENLVAASKKHRVAFIYGSDHLQKRTPNNLIDLLGRKNIFSIGLFPNQQDIVKSYDPNSIWSGARERPFDLAWNVREAESFKEPPPRPQPMEDYCAPYRMEPSLPAFIVPALARPSAG